MSEDNQAEAQRRWDALTREQRYEYQHAQFWQRWEQGRCPICDAEGITTERVGHCLYSRPCGHRLWQCDGKSDEPMAYTMAGMRVRI
jgi:hypothetical protein